MKDGIEILWEAGTYTVNYGDRGTGVEFTSSGETLSVLLQELADELAEAGL